MNSSAPLRPVKPLSYPMNSLPAIHCQSFRASSSYPEPFRLGLPSLLPKTWTVYALDPPVCGMHKMRTARFDVSHADVFRHCKVPRQTPRGLCHTHSLGVLAYIPHFLQLVFSKSTYLSACFSVAIIHQTLILYVKVNFPPM